MNVRRALELLDSLSFRQAAWLLPLTMGLHVAEEAPHFPSWLSRHAAIEMTHLHFVRNNAFFVSLATVGCVAAWRIPRRGGAWLVLFFCGLYCFWNALFHVGATSAFGVYSPGVITAVVLYVPLWFRLNSLAFREGLISNLGGSLAFVTSGALHAALIHSIWWQQRVPLDWLHALIGIE